ncbi:outer membrane protein assembly factor BamE [Variovorax sp. JS1663]|uniref:outer membrane protein assembly factor BamE n=1 Tax=Variovorax sp. JS1663 TaxID=1851577 RepID=UPI000B343728|nr:outer membrane protein assembly factor BamE [Variovorax sp. JS1663]OUL99412.1 cell envelope protein SmpA [Variovorax sp. JS1663]
MPEISQRRLWLLVGAVAAMLSLGACSSFTERSRSALYAITPYKVEVVQGNFVSKEQVELLKPGMSRQQVREILGTSLLNDVFHANRWDYVFTIRRQGVEAQQRRLTLFFNGEVLDRFEGDPMPSEQEFVAAVDARGRAGKVPVLEATEDQLKKFDPAKDKEKSAESDTASASLPPLPPSYPPLESGR